MRRVVVTGMGIVSSIGNNTQEVLASLHEAKSGITRPRNMPSSAFARQVQGAPTLNPGDVVDRRAMRFLGEGAAWNSRCHGTGDSAIPVSSPASLQRSHRHHHGFRRPFGANHRRGCRYCAHQGTEAASVRSRCPRRCRPRRRRRLPPGSRSRASTIRSRRPARPRTIASAMPMRRSRSASRTSFSPAAARSWTGRCRFCSTPWARCPRNTTIRRRPPRGPMTSAATAS